MVERAINILVVVVVLNPAGSARNPAAACSHSAAHAALGACACTALHGRWLVAGDYD